MTVAGLIFLSVGLLLLLISAIGLLRFPDFFSRVHAVSKSETLGMIFLLFGLMLYQGFDIVSLKFAMIIVFVAIANPTAAHLLTRAAVRTGLLPWRRD